MRLLSALTFAQHHKRNKQAEQEEVDIRLHRIIYKALEEIETAMKGY